MTRIAFVLAIFFLIGCSTDAVQTGSIRLNFSLKSSQPTSDSLYPVYPNPFNRVIGDTAILIQFAIRDTGTANVLVQNAFGDLIANYYDSVVPAGIYLGTWYPEASDGSRLSNGIYYVTLQNGAFIDSRLVNIQENE
ncbi:MAG TPA: hypothetical protein VGM92_13665 [Candidatus Kapabacteria bacterium]